MFSRPTFLTNIIASLATTSQERGLTADQFKAKFDIVGTSIKTFIENTLIPECENVKIVNVTASKTLSITDSYTLQICTHATTSIAITIPANSAVAFPIGTQIALKQGGAAQVSVVGSAGVTIEPAKLKLNGQYSTAVLVKEDTDKWGFTGSIKA